MKMSRIYLTVKIQGKATELDLKQFSSLGIPIYQSLFNLLATEPDQFKSDVQNLKVSYENVKSVFLNMTTEGGIFYK
jgi:hypothetical protein